MKKLFLLVALLGLTLPLRAQDAVFIVHPTLADTTLSAEEVKHVLLGNLTKWRHGLVIKLVVLTDGPLHTKIIRDYTQRTPDQFDKFWKKQVFIGAGTLPAHAKNEAEVIAYVAANPGALGYISRGNLTDQVKTLPVKAE